MDWSDINSSPFYKMCKEESNLECLHTTHLRYESLKTALRLIIYKKNQSVEGSSISSAQLHHKLQHSAPKTQPAQLPLGLRSAHLYLPIDRITHRDTVLPTHSQPSHLRIRTLPKRVYVQFKKPHYSKVGNAPLLYGKPARRKSLSVQGECPTDSI